MHLAKGQSQEMKSGTEVSQSREESTRKQVTSWWT